jgi:predicted RND superfamily exporter protein
LNLPFNLADVIVLPLLLGVGVDSGIHLLHRHRTADRESVLRTSTARGVLFSALTTIASFGTLAFSTHRGIASLGMLLTVGLLFVMFSNLVFLPALIVWLERRSA